MLFAFEQADGIGFGKNVNIFQKEKEYQVLSELTTNKSIPLIKYHCYSILKQNKRPVWTKEED